jgi:hypothetical protein
VIAPPLVTEQEFEQMHGLIEQSIEDGAARVKSDPSETTRRITELKNRRERVKDTYEAGVYSVRDLQKRVATIDGELAVLSDLLEPDSGVSLSMTKPPPPLDLSCSTESLVMRPRNSAA